MAPKPRKTPTKTPPKKSPAKVLMRLVPNNPVVQLLRSRMLSGEIRKGEKPAKVHKSDPQFEQYDINRFRTCYNNLKDELYDYESGMYIFLFFALYFDLNLVII